MITAIMTSMGRLEHVKQSLPLLLRNTEMDVIVVDYACPDGTFDWVSEQREGWPHGFERVHLARLRSVYPVFHKARAQNGGLRLARSLGAEFVCLLDADTLVPDERFYSFCCHHLAADRFLVAQTHPDFSDLTGFLLAPRRALEEVGGFDERFVGWGSEDLDLRLRLFLRAGLSFQEMPPEFLRSIAHSDAERTRFYVEKDKLASHERNLKILIENACDAAGAPFEEVFARPEIQRLIYCYPGVEGEETAC